MSEPTPAPDALGVPPVRLGVLGAARVVPYALIAPARQTPGVELEAIASRSLEKSRALAAAHGVPRAYGSYEALLDDAAIDAVYVALPTALHAPWVRRALAAGKHVLCEKPLAMDAAEAQALAAEAGRAGRVLVEGLHLRYMSRLARQRAIVESGEIGALRSVDATFRLPRVPMAADDFRLSAALGGGALFDIGCYAVSCLRVVAGGEPRVTAARAKWLGPGVDRWACATLDLPGGATGRVECGFRGWYLPRMAVEAVGTQGRVAWSTAGLTVRAGGRTRHEACVPDWTYQRQLAAFTHACRRLPHEALPTEDAVATARVIDAIRARLAGRADAA